MDETDGSKPRQSSGIVMTQAGSDTVLYDPQADAVHILNPTAALVWELCDGQHTTLDIESALRDHFAGTSERDIAADVQECLAHFAARKLVTYDQ